MSLEVSLLIATMMTTLASALVVIMRRRVDLACGDGRTRHRMEEPSTRLATRTTMSKVEYAVACFLVGLVLASAIQVLVLREMGATQVRVLEGR